VCSEPWRSTPLERGVSGAGIGAAAGAIGGAVVGAPGTGAAVGAAVGGAAGALTEPEDVDLGDPVWKKKNRSR
jgi:osmotically inducible lipoprotein OsmB